MQDVSKGEGRTVLFVSHNMFSVKKLCTKGVVLKNGCVDFLGGVSESINYYLNEVHNNLEKLFFPDLSKAPGNEFIRIRSMEVASGRPDGSITIDDDIHVKLVFFNFLKDSMIDCTFELHTSSDIVVFHRWYNFSPNKNSVVGEQSISFIIPSHLLNAGKYYFLVSFGENEAHRLWGDLQYSFEVKFTKEDVLPGLICNQKPGIIRPDILFKHELINRNHGCANTTGNP